VAHVPQTKYELILHAEGGYEEVQRLWEAMKKNVKKGDS